MDLVPKTLFIGIGGGSASGKSAISDAISARFAKRVPIISQDWFYRSIADKSLGPAHNWDIPTSFNRELIIECLRGWKAGKSMWTPRHDYANYEQLENRELIEAAPVMIFEGILAFEDPTVASLLDMKIYVDCDPDVALSRRILRDIKERKYDLDLILKRYAEQVKPAFDNHILPMKKIADIVIPNNGSAGVYNMRSIDIVETYIEHRLSQ